MTSSSEEIFLSSRKTHSDLNGDIPRSSDMVPSVHDNVFFKAFGRPSRYHSTPRSEDDHKRNGSEGDILTDDDIGEYHPGSGFVTKLLGKFSNLSSKEDNVTPRLKRSSSLEGDATIDKDAFKKPLTPKETSKTEFEKPGLSFKKLSQKAESIESLNNSAHKSRSVFPVSLRHIERRDNTAKPLKSPRESHVIAPDADLARDDIVIIENSPVPPLALEESDDSKEDITPSISSYRDEAPIEELPKPNTVLNVRSIFETASAGSTSSITHGRKQKSNSISEIKNETVSSKDKDRIRNDHSSSSPVTSPRISSYDAPPPSWLTRRNSIDSSAATTTISTDKPNLTTNYSKFSSHDDRPVPNSNSDITSSSSQEKRSIFDRGSLFDSGKVSDSSRPSPSPRSTASVKPTVASKPVTSINVKPIPISTPPSAATSFKKSPVVPVAPFKKQEEKVDDGSPVMIYEKPKSPTRKVRPQRTKKYDDLSSKPCTEKKGDDSRDFIIPNDKKKAFEKENEANKNQFEKISTSPDVSEVRTFENNIANNREKTFSFIKPTVNDVADITLPKPDNRNSSSVSVGKDKTTISIGKNKTTVSVSNESGSKLEAKRYKAPIPNKSDTERPEKESIKSKRAPEPPSTKALNDKSQSMIYISSSSETSESDSSPPETPRTQPVKVSERVRICDPVRIPGSENISEKIPEKKNEKVSGSGSIFEKVPEKNNEKEPKSIFAKVPEKKYEKEPESVFAKLPESKYEKEPESIFAKLPERKYEKEPESIFAKLPEKKYEKEPESIFAKVSEKKSEDVSIPEPENNDKPIKGIPSIIANRLNKQNNSPRDLSNSFAGPDSVIRPYNNDSDNDKSHVFKNNNTDSIRNIENANQQPTKDAVSSEIENEIAAVRRKINSNRSKSGGPAQIFDSSQLAKKRQENKRQKAAAAAAASQGIVPRLDFSSLNEDNNKSERILQKEIKPCNIKFIGENAKTSRSLLKKQRKVKANVQFSETICETFEYPNEEQALECYLQDHPNEPRELDEEQESNGIMFLDSLSRGRDFGESSDDVDTFPEPEPAQGAPSQVNEDDNLKSNPALSSPGNTLHFYKWRHQEEFEFGKSMFEPEPTPQPAVADPAEDPDSMTLRPAKEDEENVESFLTTKSSDLLF